MRFWKPQLALALASAAAAVLALAVALFFRRGVVDVLLMILIGAALVGMYLLRRYAREELLYHARAEKSPQSPTTLNRKRRAERPTSVPDREVIPGRRIGVVPVTGPEDTDRGSHPTTR